MRRLGQDEAQQGDGELNLSDDRDMVELVGRVVGIPLGDREAIGPDLDHPVSDELPVTEEGDDHAREDVLGGRRDDGEGAG